MPFMSATQPYERPAPLTGPIRTRGQARIVYGQIVSDLASCEDARALETYLLTIGEELIQFEGELTHFWLGDGEEPFLGLDQEIKRAWERLSVDW